MRNIYIYRGIRGMYYIYIYGQLVVSALERALNTCNSFSLNEFRPNNL